MHGERLRRPSECDRKTEWHFCYSYSKGEKKEKSKEVTLVKFTGSQFGTPQDLQPKIKLKSEVEQGLQSLTP